ncbi:MAG: hypothetical protein CVV02_14595 [Firmicutes bacterium HGW-Firmicutes-7]|nr:MAG: hypothetical protein CVV02_14595 [Firmicutes bacterium HGW-Firmicutes-7]
MNILLVYYSHTGNNEKLAFELRDQIGCDIYKIEEKKKRKTLHILFDFLCKHDAELVESNIDLRKYKIIILVAPIWGSKIPSPIRAFIEREKSYLNKYFYVSICNGEEGQKEKIENELYSIIQVKPIQVLELTICYQKKRKIKLSIPLNIELVEKILICL